MPWIAPTPDGVVLTLHVVPRSARDEVCGLHGDALKVKLHAPPVEGKANRALAAFLAERLGVPKAAVTILSGHAGRHKGVAVAGTREPEARRLLLPCRDARIRKPGRGVRMSLNTEQHAI